MILSKLMLKNEIVFFLLFGFFSYTYQPIILVKLISKFRGFFSAGLQTNKIN